MSVNRISQSHANEAHAVQGVNLQKSLNAETKANAVVGPNNSRVHAEPAAEQARAAATAASNPGGEQSHEQSTDTDTNGTRVNVFA
jgi:hypothetical protein